MKHELIEAAKKTLSASAIEIVEADDFKKEIVQEGLKDKEYENDPDLDSEEQAAIHTPVETGLPKPTFTFADFLNPEGSRDADKRRIRDGIDAEDEEYDVMPSDIDHKRNEITEEKGDKEEYQKVFRAALKKFGVEEPDELEGDKKKEFFDYVDSQWKSDKEEMNEAEQTIVEDFKKELHSAVKADEVVELELDDGDSVDIDPDTAKVILAKSKGSDLMKAGKNRDTFMKYMQKILR